MKSVFKNIRKGFANKHYRNAFFGAIVFVSVGALVGAGIASGIGLFGAAGTVTVAAVLSGAAMGGLGVSAAGIVGGTLLLPLMMIGSMFLGNQRDGELGGALHGLGAAGLASLAALAITDGQKIMQDRLPTPEQRIAPAANKAFECPSTAGDVQITRNPQGEPIRVTVTCRR